MDSCTVGKEKLKLEAPISARKLVKKEIIVKSGTKIKFEFKKVKVEDPEGPYPDFSRPSPVESRLAVSLLGELHGTPTRGEITMPVLDSLVRTILSQNTTDKNSRTAFLSLKKEFPTWREVYDAVGTGRVEESIKFGGLSDIKAYNIHMILAYLLQEHPEKCPAGEPSYEWLREMPTEFCKAELSKHKGVGPKTVSCVLMFNMHRAEFPVDTHVWFIAKKLGWVPTTATAETTYSHLNLRIPEDLKYPLHILLVEHGKRCPKCAKGGKLQLPEEGACPLSNFQDKVAKVTMNGGMIMTSPTKEYIPWFVKMERGTELKREKTSTVDGKEKKLKSFSSSSPPSASSVSSYSCDRSRKRKKNDDEIKIKEEPEIDSTFESGRKKGYFIEEDTVGCSLKKVGGKRTLQHLGNICDPYLLRFAFYIDINLYFLYFRSTRWNC